MEFENKLVAVLNEKIEPGTLMNALAHATVGLGALVGKENLQLTDYQDKSGNSHANVSEMPFIVLSARNSGKLREYRKALLAEGIAFVDFTDTMTIGTYVEQIERSAITLEENLEYYCVVAFGNFTKLSELTKKFSIWK